MLSTCATISMNEEGKEIMLRGTPGFACDAYIGDVHKYVGEEIVLHWHSEMEMFVLLEGQVQVIFADSSYTLRPGEIYFVNADVLHGVTCKTDRPCVYHSIVFDQSVISGCPQSVFENKYIAPFVKGGPPFWIFHLKETGIAQMSSLFDVVYSACKQKKEGFEFVVRDALSQMILLLSGRMEKEYVRVETIREQRLKQMLKWIDEHYMEKVTVNQIAGSAGICVRECQRTFSEVMNDTPIRYLMRRRIAIAADMLRASSTDSIDIYEKCGFENQSYFIKQFKIWMGVTPGHYQRTMG